MVMDYRAISLDIETYGICTHAHDGTPLPTQGETKKNGRFHPRKCMFFDGPRGLRPEDLIQTVAITLIEEDTRCPRHAVASDPMDSSEKPSPTPTSSVKNTRPPRVPSSATSSGDSSNTLTPSSNLMAHGWDLDSLTKLKPSSTMVFLMYLPEHRHRLAKWLMWAETLFLMNGPFDLGMLRHYDPIFRQALDGYRHLLIDVSALNYLQNELRPEKSLKNLGPVLRTHVYKDRPDRFESPDDSDEQFYNGSDTHNNILSIAELARRIAKDYPSSDKLSPFCIQHYSDAFWTVIRMSEAGMCMDRNQLLHLEQVALRKCEHAHTVSVARFNTRLQGEDSDKDKLALIERICTYITRHVDPTIRDHPLFQLTEVQRKISINDVNRRLFEHILAPHSTDPEVAEYLLALRLLGIHLRQQKLVSSYTYPLLRFARKDRTNRTSRLIGATPCTPNSHRSPSNSQTAPPGSAQPPTSKPSTARPAPTVPATPTSPPSSTPSTPPAKRQRQNRTRTANQWKVRHQQKLLRTGRTGTHKKQSAARSKGATPLAPLVTYHLPPPTSRTPWTQPQAHRDRAFAYSSYFVTPAYEKDSGGAFGGTIQGRITAKGPARQTFPPSIDACQVSRWEGGFIVSYDLDQIELKVPAVASGEPVLLAAFDPDNPIDLHTKTAIDLFTEAVLLPICGAPLDKSNPTFRDDWRDPAKHINFGRQYRAGAAKQMMTVLRKSDRILPLSLFQQAVDRRPYDMPVFWHWQEKIIREARDHGYLHLPFIGQTRMFMGGEKYDVSEIVNFPIQTTAGNILLRLQAYCHLHGLPLNHRNPSYYMISQVYDSIQFDCRDQAAVNQCNQIMSDAIAFESTHGYWRAFCDHHGHFIPLTYSTTIGAAA